MDEEQLNPLGTFSVSREAFGTALDAWFLYVAGQPGEAPRRALEAALVDGTWESAPLEWLTAMTAATRPEQTAWTRAVGMARLSEAMRAGAVNERPAVHMLFPAIIAESVRLGQTGSVTSLVAWFVAGATAAEASIAATALYQSQAPGERSLLPLLRWLLHNGAAILRGRECPPTLLPNMAKAVLQYEPDLAPLVLRYCLVAENAGNTWFDPSSSDLFWRTVESALEHGLGDGVIVDLSCLLNPSWGAWRCFHPFRVADLPRTRKALTTALCAGRLPSVQLRMAWQAAFSPGGLNADAEDIVSIEPRTAAAGLEELSQMSANGVQENRGLERWVATLVAAVVTAEFNLASLEKLVAGGQEWRIRGVCAGIRVAADGLPRALADAGPPTAFLAAAAIRLLRAAPRVKRKVEGTPAAIESLRIWLEQKIVLPPWTEPVGGIRLWEVLRGARRVEFATLEDEDKVRIDGDTARVDSGTLERIAGVPDENRRRALAAIYLLHELVHVAQGIGGKEVVQRVRAAGAETTLQHLDLAADHATAALVAKAVPKWSIAWIKNLQGESLAAYPVGPYHTGASRARKALRLVSLRFDSLVRTRGWAIPSAALNEGYLFVDFGPAGGTLLALAAAAPWQVLASVALGPADAKVLSACADAGRDTTSTVAEVDAILERLLAGALDGMGGR